MMREKHKAAMHAHVEVLTPRGQLWQNFLGGGKVEINELLWKHLPPEATLQMAEDIALDIWDKIADAWEKFPFPQEAPTHPIPWREDFKEGAQ